MDVPRQLAPLLALAPLLTRLPEVLSAAAKALHESGMALRWVHGNVSAAGGVFDTAANTAHNATLDLPPMLQFNNTTLFCIPPSFAKDSNKPLQALEANLRSAALNLQASTDVATINGQLRDIGQVAADILIAAKLVGKFAKDIGGSPPNEVIQ